MKASRTTNQTSTNKSNLTPILLSSLVTALLFVGIYLLFFNKTNQNANLAPLSSATIVPSPVVTKNSNAPLGTADFNGWDDYSNGVHSISFKYPSNWNLVKENDRDKYNASIKLTKDQATIHIVLGVDGIGGSGADYQGQKFVLDGNQVYKYKAHNTYNNSETVGITDTLSQSLGVLMLNKKTYIISLNYPSKYLSSGESANLEKIFDQILSTFKFNK